MAQQATSRTIDLVTSVWQHLLHRSDIGITDNFFEIGGTPETAAELCREIERRLGRYIPPLAIYETPTISSLTEAMQGSSFPKISSIMPLKRGDGRAPLYIAHGIGGTVLEFFELLKHVNSNRTVYGMQAKGSDGVSEPLDRVEDMAEFHLEEIRKLQPRGPYFLAGHSLGGLVVLEIARRILKNGENPGILVLIDSYPHVRYLAPKQQARLIVQLAARRVFGTSKPPRHAYSKQANENRQTPGVPTAINQAMHRVREQGYVALEKYRPRFYNGKIRFIKAEKLSVFPEDPVAVWARLAKEFDLKTVPGDHIGMLSTYAQALAAAISQYDREMDALTT